MNKKEGKKEGRKKRKKKCEERMNELSPAVGHHGLTKRKKKIFKWLVPVYTHSPLRDLLKCSIIMGVRSDYFSIHKYIDKHA